MIQFNLLPDIKQEFIKSKRNKHIVFVSSFIVAASSVGILVLLFLGVVVWQKGHMDRLSKDIKVSSEKLKSTPELDKILTIQNQLNSLTALHNKRPVASRLYEYLPKITPTSASIQKLDIDFSQNVMNISGNTDAISTVNKFVDTLKFTTYYTGNFKGDWESRGAYKVGDVVRSNGSLYVSQADHNSDSNTEAGIGSNWKSSWKLVPTAFSKVVLGTFGINSDEEDPAKKVSYQISLAFDATIFDSSKTVVLTVPQIISTRSETEKPDLPLFDSANTNQNNAGQ